MKLSRQFFSQIGLLRRFDVIGKIGKRHRVGVDPFRRVGVDPFRRVGGRSGFTFDAEAVTQTAESHPEYRRDSRS